MGAGGSALAPGQGRMIRIAVRQAGRRAGAGGEDSPRPAAIRPGGPPPIRPREAPSQGQSANSLGWAMLNSVVSNGGHSYLVTAGSSFQDASLHVREAGLGGPRSDAPGAVAAGVNLSSLQEWRGGGLLERSGGRKVAPNPRDGANIPLAWKLKAERARRRPAQGRGGVSGQMERNPLLTPSSPHQAEDAPHPQPGASSSA